MLFILKVLRELTLPLLSDTEISCTEVDIKFRGSCHKEAPKHRHCER